MPKKIVVIEDDNDILDLIQYILEDEGYQVLPAGQTGNVDAIAAHQPDLVLLDDRLPGEYGHVMCSRIKSNPRTQNIPVVLVSATRDLEKVAFDCKADDFLPKPFDLDDLLTLVKQYT
jgi:two-component system, OmpR family, phosphate regulon response regulator PhoB